MSRADTQRKILGARIQLQRRTLALARAAFEAAIEEKPADPEQDTGGCDLLAA